MKQFLLKKSIYAVLFLSTFFLMEMFAYLFMFGTVTAVYGYLDLLFAIILVAPIFFYKNKLADIIYLSLIMLIVTILCIANTNYYLVFGDIFSLQYLSLIQKGTGVFSFSFIDFFHLIISIVLYVSYVAALIIFRNIEIEDKDVKKYPLKRIIAGSMVGIISITSFSITLNVNINNEKNNSNLGDVVDVVTMAKNANFEKYGMLSYYVREAQYLSQGVSYNELKKMKPFLTEEKYTGDNEIHGSLENYNVVTIMVETGISKMVNETLTPTLYQLMNDGINCTNHISKNKTNFSEMIGITGSGCTAGINSYDDYYMPFSVPSLLNENYRTMYFHDCGGSGYKDIDIYERDVLIEKYGFENVYLHEQIHPDKEIWDWGDYILDSETMHKVTDMMLEDTEKPIYSFFTSLSMHGPYFDSITGEVLLSKYGEILEDAKEKGLYVNPLEGETDESCFDHYMMACIDFDLGLKYMIDEFKKAGEFENTLFVLYGDHDLYYVGKSNNMISMQLAGYEETRNSFKNWDIYKTVYTLYNPTLTAKYKEVYNIAEDDNCEIDKLTSPYTIVPSILDVLGVDFYSNLYIGESLFSNRFHDEQHIFYSLELSSFFNEYYWTDDGLTLEKSFLEEENAEYENAFFNKVSKIMKRQLYLDLVYNNDFFKSFNYDEL